MNLKLWNNIDFNQLGRKSEMSLQSLGYSVLLKDAFAKMNTSLVECGESGQLVPGKYKVVLEEVEKLGGHLIYQYKNDEFKSSIWIWDNSLVELELSGGSYISLNGLSQNPEFIDRLRGILKPHLKPENPVGHIYAIVSQNGRLSLNSIGNAGVPLIRQNYSPKVLDNYDYVINDLQSVSPSGRIVILEGEPGTGKTHLVRGMLLEIFNALFILVSPEMVTALGGPEFLPLLLQYKHITDGPIILILEDADKCLVTRGGDNINAIQSLLNLGDGILGSLLDIRIIATTNANKLEMEAAILRPGRLSRRLEVGALDKDTALGIIKHLLPENQEALKDPRLLAPVGKDGNPNHITLAQVYSIARSYGWSPSVYAKESKVEDPRPQSIDYDDEDDDFYS